MRLVLVGVCRRNGGKRGAGGATRGPCTSRMSTAGVSAARHCRVRRRAFATAGAMTGAWYLATNVSLSFSEQQIVVGGRRFAPWAAPTVRSPFASC